MVANPLLSPRVKQCLQRSLVACATALAGNSRAAPLAHEYIPESPPPRIVVGTPTGPRVTATPELMRSPTGATGPGVDRTQPSAASTLTSDGLTIDVDTTAPDSVAYEDPFTPHVTPFKRSRAYDAVTADGRLKLASTTRTLVPRATAQPGEDTFHLYQPIVLRAGELAPLATPGPDAHWNALFTDPPAPLEVLTDSAGNWWLRASRDFDGTVTGQLSLPRSRLGGDFEAIGAHASSAPEPVRQAAERVARALELSRVSSQSERVRRLVQHFRAFIAAESPPLGTGLELYEHLALGGRGVCRHRAYAFTVTALGLGIPVRFVMNEAHAWVEVLGRAGWRRIDLGGAASTLSTPADERPEHVPLPDPFEWPALSEPGSSLALRRPSPARPSGGEAGTEPRREALDIQQGAPAATSEQPRDPSNTGPTGTSPVATQDGQGPRTVVSLRLAEARAARGSSLAVEGTAEQHGRACPYVSVDVSVGAPPGPPRLLGRFVTDERGQFRGDLLLPYWVSLGENILSAKVSEPQPCQKP